MREKNGSQLINVYIEITEDSICSAKIRDSCFKSLNTECCSSTGLTIISKWIVFSWQPVGQGPAEHLSVNTSCHADFCSSVHSSVLGV